MDEADGQVELELIGSRIDVRLAGAGAARLEKALRTSWDRCLAPDPAAPPVAVVEAVLDTDPYVLQSARDRGAVAGDDELPVMSALTQHLTTTAIAARHGELLMLHACALADPATGRSVVLVAPSGTGKTTAALTLGRDLGYLSDETVAIGAGDLVTPYPKPLSLLVDGLPPKVQTSPTALGLLPAPPSPRVAAVALLHRVPDAADPRIDLVPVLEALPALAEQSSALQLLPRPLHLLADLLERTGGLRRITYREVEDAAPLITSLLEGDPA